MKPLGLLTCSAFLLCVATTAVVVAPAATPITPLPAGVSSRVAVVQVRVAPDHRDWTYALGENARFKVTVTADNEPIDGVTINYTIGPEMMPAETKTATLPLDGIVLDGGTMSQPGFLRCAVTAEVNGKTWRGLATAGFAPDKIVATQTDPKDFDAFWQASKDALAKTPLDARTTLLPDAGTADVNVYHVNLRNQSESWGPPARVYGILCEPKAPGKYPAVLKVPGAGIRPYNGDPALAARGAIVLEIGIHGIPVNLPQAVYDSLSGGPLRAYWSINLDNRDTYYYRRVYLGCVRANDFLASHPMWNGKDLLVMGASQGGQLSIVTAALDPRVTALAVTHPAGCDWTGDLHGRAGGWPQPFRRSADGKPSFHETPAKLETARYYDAVNFARRLKVPGHYLWGYNDETCPPTSMHAAYNAITAPKELHLLLELGHSYPPEQSEAAHNWVAKTLGLK